MGCCLSKNEPSPLAKTTNQITKPQPIVHQTPETFTALLENNPKPTVESLKSEEKPAKQDEKGPKQKKEIFVIQHRKSNDRRPEPKPLSDSDISDPYTDTTTNNSSDNNPHSPLQTTSNPKKPAGGGNILAAAANGQAVRTSSCTKEELDAILIQCGRLSRSSSGKGNSVGISSENRRKYSGSKRSHDFDKEIGDLSIEFNCEADDERHRRRQSRGSSGSRRRTPSRSRERDQLQQNRSGSRERGGTGGGGRRVSRSPGRRSDSPIGNGNGTSSSNSGTSSNNNKPGKMVSVPATVTNLSSMDKNNNGGGSNDGVKRVLVKRNVGGDVGSNGLVSSRNAASPSRRSRSPTARTKFGDENNNNQQQQTLSLSRNSSRKAEHSPYRRTPLNEIDTNSLPFQPLASKTNKTQQLMKNKEIEEEVLKLHLNNTAQPQRASNGRGAVEATHHRRTHSRGSEGIEINYSRMNDHQPPQIVTENKGGEQQLKSNNYDDQLQLSGSDSLKLPQTIVRSRSLRRSRDLDINLDALLNPNPVDNYNSLLLQDIQKFHHNKNSANPNPNTPTSNNNTNPNLTLPTCVTKACSILEAVADLNSSTTSGFSSGFTDNNMQRSLVPDLCSRKDGNSYSFTDSNNNPVSVGKKKFEGIAESQANVGGDDLMEPSFHKYVTVRNKDSRGGGDMEQEESSGSNSYVGSGGQHWFSNSSKEPNSADSTNCWTSRSSSNTRGDDKLSPVGFNRLALTERNDEESRMKLAKRGPGNNSMCAVAGASI